MQEAMPRAWRSLDKLTDRGSLRAWLATNASLYSRWPDHEPDPRLVESVFRRFGLPDQID